MKKIYFILISMLCFVLCFTSFGSNFYKARLVTKMSTTSTTLPVPGFTNMIHTSDPTQPVSLKYSKLISQLSDTLHFNALVSLDDRAGTDSFGLVGQPLTDSQIIYTNNLIESLKVHHMNYMMSRAKIEKPCYGQRCVYEVLQGTHIFDNDETNPFNDGFAYQNCSGDYITDSSRTVLHLTAGSSNSGIIAENIFENLQHIDFKDFLEYTTDTNDWHLKPMVRIKTSDFNNSLIQEDIVFSIKIYNFHSDTIKTIPIRVKDFKVDSGNTTYNGEYIEKFNVSSAFLNVSGTDLRIGIEPKNISNWNNNCHMDFKIEWPGNVDVWFDKLTVDDDVANDLFNGAYDQDIQNEANAADGTNTSILLNTDFFYCIDELTYSVLPCINYVQEKYKASRTAHQSLKLNVANSQWMFAKGLKNNNVGIKHLMSLNHPDRLNLDIAELPLCFPENLRLSGPSASAPLQSEISGKPADIYNNELQGKIGAENVQNSIGDWGSYLKQVSDTRKAARENLTTANMYFSVQPQLQSNMSYSQTNHVWENTREPTNEELQMQAMISIAHGADGLDWWWVPSLNEDFNIDSGSVVYGLDGILLDYSPSNPHTYLKRRNSNMFGQDKFSYVASMNLKLKNWKPWLDRIKWQAGYSLHAEYSSAMTGYISNIKSMKGVYGSTSSPDPSLLHIGNDSDATNADKFWEIAFFDPNPADTQNANDHSKYFLIANRRCYPTKIIFPESVRGVQIRFNKNNLYGFNNWRITDVNTDSSIVFNKITEDYVDLGTRLTSLGFFQPGEGKLFRLQPVMETGGILAGDEDVSGQSFNCMGTVFNAGHNIKMTGVTINFDSSAGIKMNSGKLQIGNITADNFSTLRLNLKGMPGEKWNGIECNNSSFAYFNQVDFNDIKDTLTVLTSINTDTLVCQNSRFYCSQSTLNHPSGVNIVTGEKRTSNNSFISSIFNMSASSPYAINMASIGANRSNFYMSYVTISPGGSNTGGNGVILSGCNAIIKNSNFTGYMNTITSSSSDIHLLSNYFKSSGTSAALTGNSYSNLYLAANDKVALGGNNNFDYSSYSSSMKNIHIDVSTFDMWGGSNKFYIDTVNNSSNYHIDGTFNFDREINSEEIDLSGNCFYNGTQASNPNPLNPICNLHDAVGNSISILYEPSPDCDPIIFGDVKFVDNIGAEVADTVYNVEAETGGGGGGKGSGNEEANNNISGNISKKEIEQTTGAAFKLHSSIEVSYRKHDLDSVYNKCNLYLNNYFDSTSTSNAITRLYSSAAELDKKHPLTGQSRMSLLKTYYEGLILSHSDNLKIVKMLFYYIQKSKIALRDFGGAMSGLQQIMNQNPYSYEGLIASWDYMSAYVQSLDSSGSGGGGKGGELNGTILSQEKRIQFA